MKTRTKRYKCDVCGESCQLIAGYSGEDQMMPEKCPYDDNADWQEVPESEPGNSLTLHYEFLPCPCCGGKPDFYIGTEFESGRGVIYCKNCLLKMDALDLQDLSERWNKRVTLD